MYLSFPWLARQAVTKFFKQGEIPPAPPFYIFQVLITTLSLRAVPAPQSPPRPTTAGYLSSYVPLTTNTSQLEPAKLEARNTEADVVVAVILVVAAPARGTDVNATVVPAPAAYHAERPRRRAHRISLASASITAVPVPAPLPYIPMHII